ncbi:flagellar basal body-associated FliL family protein [[Roseibacterium] beibuensis]|uniref:Flagellar protein FliL n=1 Tax=[Roseibacterium] beibuensis TaxID=1193142 RepID=A0ABP9LEW5_9RHOB|nr:flagellar basal body-associated FliL family protein [Roseibacterium beibuensis]
MITGIDMAQDDDSQSPKKKRGLLLPLLLGLVLAGAAGGGGFWAVTSGPFGPDSATEEDGGTHASEAGGDHGESGHQEAVPVDVAFVPLDTVVITLGSEISGADLIFTAELEVAPEHEAEVAHLSPRVLDVLNSYLRVIDLSELTDPTSLARIRAQLLRRIQVVTGAGRVSDLLVTQFVVN